MDTLIPNCGYYSFYEMLKQVTSLYTKITIKRHA